MKIKSLLLLGLAGFALASCGGPKSYKTEVKKATFVKDLTEMFTNSPIFNFDGAYSFVSESTGESTMTQTWSKNNKKLTEKVSKSSTSSYTKFDCDDSILSSEHSQYYDDSLPVESEKTEQNVTYIYQVDNKNIYCIDKEQKLYLKESSSDPKKELETEAMREVSTVISLFEIYLPYESEDMKYYEDGKVFTIVLESKEESTEATDYLSDILQISFEDDGYDVYSITRREYTSLNFKKVVDDVNTIKFRKKDRVKLDSISLESYLEVDELPSVLY